MPFGSPPSATAFPRLAESLPELVDNPALKLAATLPGALSSRESAVSRKSALLQPSSGEVCVSQCLATNRGIAYQLSSQKIQDDMQ